METQKSSDGGITCEYRHDINFQACEDYVSCFRHLSKTYNFHKFKPQEGFITGNTAGS